MNYSQIAKIAMDLPKDIMTSVYRNHNAELFIYRPNKLSSRFKDYDVDKNFQIFLKEGNNEAFRPNHLRLMLDLKLRVRNHPESQKLLLSTFDNIFYGMDPIEAIKPLSHFTFQQYINDLDIIATLFQLFVVEQNTGYGKKSKYNPISLYIMGWVRTFLHSDSEIDIVTMRMCSFSPPPVKYTCMDDKNHKKYNPQAKPLWYL